MIPNRFDNYENFNIPKNFRVTETNTSNHFGMITDALFTYFTLSGGKEKWGIASRNNLRGSYEEQYVGAYFGRRASSNRLVFTSLRFDIECGQQKYKIEGYDLENKDKPLRFSKLFQDSLFDPDKGIITYQIHGGINQHFIKFLDDAINYFD